MKIKKFNKYELIYLSFAFDSLLKISLGGFKLHIGILAVYIKLYSWPTISTVCYNK